MRSIFGSDGEVYMLSSHYSFSNLLDVVRSGTSYVDLLVVPATGQTTDFRPRSLGNFGQLLLHTFRASKESP